MMFQARACFGRSPLRSAAFHRSPYLPLRAARRTTYSPVPLIRPATSQAGTNHTGHLDITPDEGVLYFDNVFPLRLTWLFQLPFVSAKGIERLQTSLTASIKPESVIKDALKASELSASTSDVQINGVIPHLKDGGAFLRFSHSAPAQTVATVVESWLQKEKLRPWWNPFTRVRARLIQGRPWLEDLHRPPSCKIKVEFVPIKGSTEAAELSQEQLYSIFRPYGKLIEIQSQPTDSKVLPKYAYLIFGNTRRATMAKNCLHGITVNAEDATAVTTKLKLSYESRTKANWFRDYLVNHPRVAIPLLVALLGGFAVVVFDPIRTFFVKMHVAGTLSLSQNRTWRWLQSRTRELLTFNKKQDTDIGLTALLDDRRGHIEQLQKWLLETTETFIVVSGPRGAGKLELLEQAFKNRKNKLIIDCKPIQETRTESKTIEAMAHAVGYRPIFSWMNSISGLIDLAAQGSVGIKTGFSETLDSQIDKILNTTATALRQLALEGRSKTDKDATLGPDEYLEAHPERRPIIIIDNYLHKASDSALIYDKLAEWAARVTTASIAHVVFCTHDVSYSKSLSKALPNSIFRTVSLGDFQPSVAKRYVLSHLEPEPEETVLDETGKPVPQLTPQQRRRDLAELDAAIASVGGRLTDLEFLARRVKSGETPSTAVSEIVRQAASEILKMHLLPSAETRAWSPEQAWVLVKALASADELRYNELSLNDVYKSSPTDSILTSLEQAELISIVSVNGRPQAVRPSRPIYRSAFKLLAADDVLRARFELAILSAKIKSENGSIDAAEQELQILGSLPGRPMEISGRVKYLLAKIEKSQANVEKMEQEQGDLKGVLLSSY